MVVTSCSVGIKLSLQIRIKLAASRKEFYAATAPGLEDKLGKVAPANAVAGHIAPYFVERYKFNKDCLVIQCSGDNPNSLAGLTLSAPGDLALSLGTSDTSDLAAVFDEATIVDCEFA
ncbi:hypothetical protein ACLB2K_053332 [Fragaria x ananassa]